MGRAYESTSVPVHKSQEEIRGLLLRFGADQFTMGEGREFVGVEFVHHASLVRMRCPVASSDDAIARDARHVSQATKAASAAERERARVWRVLVWTVKARLVAVEEGIETFEQAFLSHLVNPATDQTLWQEMREPIEAGLLRLGGPGLLALPVGRS